VSLYPTVKERGRVIQPCLLFLVKTHFFGKVKPTYLDRTPRIIHPFQDSFSWMIYPFFR
jgi:hypothetical protein